MPQPVENETKKHFINRCMKELITQENKTREQAAGQCYAVWDHSPKKESK